MIQASVRIYYHVQALYDCSTVCYSTAVEGTFSVGDDCPVHGCLLAKQPVLHKPTLLADHQQTTTRGGESTLLYYIEHPTSELKNYHHVCTYVHGIAMILCNNVRTR